MAASGKQRSEHGKANTEVQRLKPDLPTMGAQPRPEHIPALTRTVTARKVADSTSTASAQVRKQHQAYTKKMEGELLEAQYAPPPRPAAASAPPLRMPQPVSNAWRTGPPAGLGLKRTETQEAQWRKENPLPGKK